MKAMSKGVAALALLALLAGMSGCGPRPVQDQMAPPTEADKARYMQNSPYPQGGGGGGGGAPR
jgi:hypothetical protein